LPGSAQRRLSPGGRQGHGSPWRRDLAVGGAGGAVGGRDAPGGGGARPWGAATAPGGEGGAWRRLRTEVAARRAAREPVAARPAPIDAAPLPQAIRADTAPALVTGEGNAEEWLGAVPSSLAPSRDAAPPVQRLRLRYRKDGP